MVKTKLHPDFKDFLKLLTLFEVEYLLVGGYAVSFFGFPRATADMDIWIAVNEENGAKAARVPNDFARGEGGVSAELFMEKDKVIRLGIPPVRIKILTGASGVDFSDCYERRVIADIDGLAVNIISLEDLKANKQAAARHKDLEDLLHLP